MPLLIPGTIAKKYSKTQEATLTFLAQGELKFPILMDYLRMHTQKPALLMGTQKKGYNLERWQTSSE